MAKRACLGAREPDALERHACPGSRARRRLAVALMAIWCLLEATTSLAQTDHRDTLDQAIAGPGSSNQLENPFEIVAGDHETYDDNLFRLPNNVVDVFRVVGPGASREDHINSASLGLADQLSIGRQIIDVNLDAQDNRYARNTDLNNVSSDDKLLWIWELGPQLSGEIGGDYQRYVPDFVNTFYYHQDLYQRREYFGTLQYQLGPHWGVFGGVLESSTTFGAGATRSNDAHGQSVEVGVDYATDAQNTIGAAYRFTDTRNPIDTVLNGVAFDPDYRENSAVLIAKYIPSDKTVIDASGGYIKREYPGGTVGSFSGDVWRVALRWQTTQKVQIAGEAWRQLQAYLTSQTDYYVSNGVSLSPTWTASEKLSLAVQASWEDQKYVGGSVVEIMTAARRNTLTGQSINAIYKLTKVLSLDATFASSKRNSNQLGFQFDDRTVKVGVSATF
jgi:exopolysaccharide biosynthesis operon protein EpsL